MSALQDIRPSPIAGRWYEGDPDRLTRQVDSYINSADLPVLPGEVIGLIAPHAGHRYSGRTAGYAFKTVLGQSYDLVIIISPYHDQLNGTFITSAHVAYATPLGVIQIDELSVNNLDNRLKELTGSGLKHVRQDMEHSLEIELPFLQRALKGEFRLLPVMVRSRDKNEMQVLGECVAEIAQAQKTLLVASSDLSHFFPESYANELDAFIENQVELLSPEGVLNADISGKGLACGAGAISAVIWASKALGADKAVMLHHSTSGETTGDRQSVVGYAAAAILRSHG